MLGVRDWLLVCLGMSAVAYVAIFIVACFVKDGATWTIFRHAIFFSAIGAVGALFVAAGMPGEWKPDLSFCLLAIGRLGASFFYVALAIALWRGRGTRS